MTKDQLRTALAVHIRTGGRRNSTHSVVAIYLGSEEYFSLLDDREARGAIGWRANGGISFDGVPVYHIAEKPHFRIVSELKE